MVSERPLLPHTTQPNEKYSRTNPLHNDSLVRDAAQAIDRQAVSEFEFFSAPQRSKATCGEIRRRRLAENVNGGRKVAPCPRAPPPVVPRSVSATTAKFTIGFEYNLDFRPHFGSREHFLPQVIASNFSALRYDDRM